MVQGCAQSPPFPLIRSPSYPATRASRPCLVLILDPKFTPDIPGWVSGVSGRARPKNPPKAV